MTKHHNKTLQTVLFDKAKWDLRSARKWLKDHDFIYNSKVDKRGNHLRFRQVDPISGARYRTKKLDNDVDLVFQYTGKRGGEFDIHDALPKIPLVVPGYQYLGPGNPLDTQLDEHGYSKPGFEPVNALDAIAKKHDQLYREATRTGTSKQDILDKKHLADDIFVAEAKATPGKNWKERAMNWISRNVIAAKRKLGWGLTHERIYEDVHKMKDIEELLDYLLRHDLIKKKAYSDKDIHKEMDEIRRKYKDHMHKLKRGGVIGIDDLIGIIIAIVTLVTAIIKIVQQQQAIAEQEREEERRAQEAEKAEKENRVLELKKMLRDYNTQLGQWAASYNMKVRDYCLLQLKNKDSEVNTMKRTILDKAAEFNMTHLQFVQYCISTAGQYSWWNVIDLLNIMQDELESPGFIDSSPTRPR
jgi:hypothetical protein